MVLHYLNRGLAFALKLHLGILGLFEDPPKPEPEPEPEPELEPELSEEEKSLAEKEAGIAAFEEKETEEKEPGEEEEVAEIDLGELIEKHPIISKLGLKTDSIKDLLEDVLGRYGGGYMDFQEGSRIKSALEKAGITDPDRQKEFFAALESGAFTGPPAGQETIPEQPKTFMDFRKNRVKEFVDSLPGVRDEETGEVVPYTEKQKEGIIKGYSDIAELIFPSRAADMMATNQLLNQGTIEEMEWLKFEMEPIIDHVKTLIKEAGGNLLDGNTRKEMYEYYQKYPHTRGELIMEARKEGKNFMKALYEHYVSRTHKDEIEAKKRERMAEEREKEDRRAKEAKAGTKGKKSKPLGAKKSFEEMTFEEKGKYLSSQT